MKRLSPTQFDTLAAIDAYHAENKKWPTFGALNAARGKKGAQGAGTNAQVRVLRNYGMIVAGTARRGGKLGISGITPDGLAALAAGRETSTKRRAEMPALAGPLPARVIIPRMGVPLIRFLVSQAKQERAPTIAEMGAAIGSKSKGRTSTLLRALESQGVITHDRSVTGGNVRITAIALGVDEGRVAVVGKRKASHEAKVAAAVQAKAGRAKSPRPRRAAPKPSRPARLASNAPVERPRKAIVADPAAVELPLPEVPALSPVMASYRGVSHPAPPAPMAPPKGLVGLGWKTRTTLPCMAGV